MTDFLCIDAFDNPASPLYYVVGVIFLVLIIGALVLYIALSNRNKKKNDDKENGELVPAETNEEQSSSDAEQPVAEDTPEEPVASEEKSDVPEGPIITEDKIEEPAVAEEPVERIAAEEPIEQLSDEKSEELITDEKSKDPPVAEEPVEQIVTEEPTDKPVEEEKPKKSTAAKKSAAKKSTKPFIDRLLETKSVHGVYNELKNTILSYSGFKAKLDKDGEAFFFGAEKRAAITLDGSTIVLHLALDPATAPMRFEAEKSDDPELPTVITVEESKIDDAQKLIIYAMNVSMLPRNDRHRHVDYVQKAQEAKQRAQKK